MSYKKYKWESIGKDYNSPFIRNYIWGNSFFEFKKLHKILKPVVGIVSRDNAIDYVVDLSVWARSHSELKAKAEKDSMVFKKIIDNSMNWGEKMNLWTKENIYSQDLSVTSNDKLVSLLKKFIDFQRTEYTFGIALPLLDFAGFSFIESNLNNFLKTKNSKKYNKYYSVFTEPAHDSFALVQEKALLKLMIKYFDDKKWRKDILQKDADQIKKIYPKFYNQLINHKEKFAGIYYVYSGPAFTAEQFLDFVKDYLNKGINPNKQLKLFENKKRINIELKKKYLNELRPDKFNRFIIDMASVMVWAKPRRKDYQSISYFHSEKLFREIGRRLYMTLDQARSLPVDAIKSGLSGKRINIHISQEIKRLHVILSTEKSQVLVLKGKEAEAFVKKYLKDELSVDKNIKELIGATACPGKVRGKAKVINSPSDMSKMEYGDILVSVATTPSIVPAMKKADAIVTDEGGLTCHASIVSRELNIPCVVGLKIISKAVKDGDIVEVDANKGIVRIIK